MSDRLTEVALKNSERFRLGGKRRSILVLRGCRASAPWWCFSRLRSFSRPGRNRSHWLWGHPGDDVVVTRWLFSRSVLFLPQNLFLRGDHRVDRADANLHTPPRVTVGKPPHVAVGTVLRHDGKLRDGSKRRDCAVNGCVRVAGRGELFGGVA